MRPTMLRTNDDRMAVSRIFGHVDPDTYSPSEYATTLSPYIEARLRQGTLKVANSLLEAHNRGVSLTLVCAKTIAITPPVSNQRVSSANEVIREHGQPLDRDFNKDISGLFESAEKLTSIAVVDARGQSYTFMRGDIQESDEAESGSLMEGGALDLSALGKPRLSTRSAPLAESKTHYVTETTPVIKAAERLLINCEGKTAPADLAYAAYLRRTISNRDTSALMQNENATVRDGAARARHDLARMAAAIS